MLMLLNLVVTASCFNLIQIIYYFRLSGRKNRYFNLNDYFRSFSAELKPIILLSSIFLFFNFPFFSSLFGIVTFFLLPIPFNAKLYSFLFERIRIYLFYLSINDFSFSIQVETIEIKEKQIIENLKKMSTQNAQSRTMNLF